MPEASPPAVPSETGEPGLGGSGLAGVVVVQGCSPAQPERKSDKDVFKSKLCFSDRSGRASHPEGSSNPGEEKIFLV